MVATTPLLFMEGFKNTTKAAKFASIQIEDLESKPLQNMVLDTITSRTKYCAVWIDATAYWYHFPTCTLLCQFTLNAYRSSKGDLVRVGCAYVAGTTPTEAVTP